VRQAAQGGDPDAQFLLGTLLYNDATTATQGMTWLRLAAERGHSAALASIRKAVNADDGAAQYHLGLMYAMGRGVSRDDTEATLLYSKAITRGNDGQDIVSVLNKPRPDSAAAQVSPSTLQELAALLGLQLDRLNDCISRKDLFYRRIAIPKSKAGIRVLDAPNASLKCIQRTILSTILSDLRPSPNATGYVRTTGLRANFTPHASSRYFLCLDVRDFFGSIKFPQVFRLFYHAGFTTYMSDGLARLCTCRGYLPQGAPTSPCISNLVMVTFDGRIDEWCRHQGIVYTRYADDMTFSASGKCLRPLAPFVSEQLRLLGMTINHHKTRLMGPKRRCVVTGMVKNSSRPVFGIGRESKRHMRAVMHAAARGVFEDERYASMQAIEGWLSFLSSVDDEAYDQMTRYWRRICAQGEGK
jgi:retron-type reverse transcriptase